MRPQPPGDRSRSRSPRSGERPSSARRLLDPVADDEGSARAGREHGIGVPRADPMGRQDGLWLPGLRRAGPVPGPAGLGSHAATWRAASTSLREASSSRRKVTSLAPQSRPSSRPAAFRIWRSRSSSGGSCSSRSAARLQAVVTPAGARARQGQARPNPPAKSELASLGPPPARVWDRRWPLPPASGPRPARVLGG